MATITSSSVANPTVITATAHGFSTGDTVKIIGHSGSTPDINGNWRITVADANTFTVPENVTTGGTGGTATLVSQVQVPLSIRTISTTALADAYIGSYPAELAWVEDAAELRLYDGNTDGGSAAGRITKMDNTLFVAKNGTDTRTGIDPHDARYPFLTVTAAQTAAASGDTILVFPGDYSGETVLAGKDGVTYQGLDGAILPGFNVMTAITVKGSGLCQSLNCAGASEVMDMPGMDTVASISCDSGTQTAGNAGTFITCTGGTQTAGNAGTHISCDSGTQTAGNAGTYISCLSGTQTAGNAGTLITCSFGTQTAGNAGTRISCEQGPQTIRLTDQSHDGTSFSPIHLEGSGILNLYGDTSTSTESGGTVVNLANSWSGSLYMEGIKLVATTVATDEATTGITYGTSVTGTVNLKDCTIITAEDGTGTAKAIDAPSAQTVYVQGTLSTTHAVDADITLAGGSAIVNTNYA